MHLTLLTVRYVLSTLKSFNLRIWPSKAIYFKHLVFIVFDSVVYLLFMLSFFISWDLLKYKSQLIMVWVKFMHQAGDFADRLPGKHSSQYWHYFLCLLLVFSLNFLCLFSCKNKLRNWLVDNIIVVVLSN